MKKVFYLLFVCVFFVLLFCFCNNDSAITDRELIKMKSEKSFRIIVETNISAVKWLFAPNGKYILYADSIKEELNQLTVYEVIFEKGLSTEKIILKRKKYFTWRIIRQKTDV